MNRNQKPKRKGIPITVSPEAHEEVGKRVFNGKPKIKTKRQFINAMLGLPKEL